MLAGVCKRDDFSSVNDCFSYNDGGGNVDDDGTVDVNDCFAGTNDDYGWRSGVDDDGSVFADVQGC